jgi:hypothetical protein
VLTNVLLWVVQQTVILEITDQVSHARQLILVVQAVIALFVVTVTQVLVQAKHVRLDMDALLEITAMLLVLVLLN